MHCLQLAKVSQGMQAVLTNIFKIKDTYKGKDLSSFIEGFAIQLEQRRTA